MSWFDEQLGGGGNALRNLPAVAAAEQRTQAAKKPTTTAGAPSPGQITGLPPGATLSPGAGLPPGTYDLPGPWNAFPLQPGEQATGFVRPGGDDPMRQLIRDSIKQAYGRDATDQDFAYWLPKLQADPDHLDYWKQRLLGQGASGADAAKFGQWAGGDPNAENFGAGATSAASSLGPTAGNFSYPAFDKTFVAPQWTQTFQAPTGVSDANDPGYTARLDAGLHAMENSAAAKGTLLTTGTQQEENQYAQDYASNEYSNVYNRALTTYGTNYQQFLNDYQQKLSQFQQDYGIYQGGFQNALATQQNNVGQNLQGAYLDLFGQNQGFSQQFSLANLGYTAAANSANNQTQLAIAQANAALGGGNTNASYLGNQGNITGANAIANGNNLAGTLGSVGNTALQSYYLQQLQNQSGYVAPRSPGFSGTGSFY